MKNNKTTQTILKQNQTNYFLRLKWQPSNKHSDKWAFLHEKTPALQAAISTYSSFKCHFQFSKQSLFPLPIDHVNFRSLYSLVTPNTKGTSWSKLCQGNQSTRPNLGASSLYISLQSRRNFGERVLSGFITKIMAAIFDFNGSERLGREKNLFQGGGRRSKIRKGVGVGERRLHFSLPRPLPPPSTQLQIKHGRSDKRLRVSNVSLH